MEFKWEHIFGHLDEVLLWDQLSDIHNLNVLVYSMAKHALVKAIVNRNFIIPEYPFEEIFLTCGGRKSIGSLSINISNWQEYNIARPFYATKKLGAKIHEGEFGLVYWKGMERLMWCFPHITKSRGASPHFLGAPRFFVADTEHRDRKSVVLSI